MLARLAAILVAANASASPAPVDSAASDTTRIVREFAPITVQAGRVDPGSIESVHRLGGRVARALPVDRTFDAIATQAGVVARSGDLHVRGGRVGQLVVTTSGVPLGDPQDGRPFEVPLFAVRSAALLAGGLDADRAGALAGELEIETESPTERPAAMARWITDGRLYGSYDAGLARVTGPLGIAGLGFAAAAEARLDDQGYPSTRTRGRVDVLGQQFGWRRDNRLLGWAKLASIDHPQRGAIEAFATRTVLAPYDPMFTFDGWLTPNPDRNFPYTISDEPVDETSFHWRAADHEVMTEERRLAIVATRRFAVAGYPVRTSLGFVQTSALTSLGLTHDASYVDDARRLLWGRFDSDGSDPFLAYIGDQQYYREAHARRWFGRADVSAAPNPRTRLHAGLGGAYDDVRLREIDAVLPLDVIPDPVRRYHARAPGGFAYVQDRWESGGLIWNTGLRLQAFTAGAQAESAATHWTLSPRLGFAYPVSDRDAFAASYARIHQDPDRDLLYDGRTYAYDVHPLGNGALEPAEVVSYQAAVRHLFDPVWSVQFGTFYRDLFGVPGVENAPASPGTFRLRYGNTDEGHANGVELTVTHDSPHGSHAELSYTWMNAWGTQSDVNGLPFGETAFGDRLLLQTTHPLDWDVHHTFAFSAVLRSQHEWTLSWSTIAASGAPWTPLADTSKAGVGVYVAAGAINSRRLPWSENTDVALRWDAKFLFGARAILTVANLFDERGDRLVTIGGWPNPVINSTRDEYSAYRTQTGQGGGGYFDAGAWVPVHDRRLGTRPRSFRIGIEVGR